MGLNMTRSFAEGSEPLSGNLDAGIHIGVPGKPGPQGADGGYYIPSVKQVSENEIILVFSPISAKMPYVKPVKIELPRGEAFTYEDFTEDQLEALKGANGFSPIVQVFPKAEVIRYPDGTMVTKEIGYTIRITDSEGHQDIDILHGDKGEKGADATDEQIRMALEDYMKDNPNYGGNVDLTGYATEQFVRDGYQPKGNYLTEHQDISGKLDANKLPEAINDALAQAKESGEFDGADGHDGYTPQKGVDYNDGADGKSAYQYAKEGGYTGTEAEFAEKLAQEPLIGTTMEITPSQVLEAITTGRDVLISHSESAWGGKMIFSSFSHAVAFDVVLASGIFMYASEFYIAELYGNYTHGIWDTATTKLAQYTDVPTALKNPYALTINGTAYDGSEAVTVDSRDLVLKVTVDETGVGTVDKTAAEITGALEAGRNVVCDAEFPDDPGTVYRLRMITSSETDGGTNMLFAMSFTSVTKYVQVMVLAGVVAVYGTGIQADITINGITWFGGEPVDFTDTINDMIDAKLATITNAEEVAF